MTKHITPHWKSQLDVFELDWRLVGLAPRTAAEYVRHLHSCLVLFPEPTAMNAKQWLEQCPTAPRRRYKACALRRFAKWLDAGGDHCMNWRTGIRRSEIARAQAEHHGLVMGILTIPVSKTGKFRTVPLSPTAIEALKGFLKGRTTGSVTQLTSDGIRSVLRRLNAPPAHAWRRGWAVHALRNGVSEVSVRTIAGWSSGAMVARYTAALSNALAVSEFERLWSK
jgi:integrase